jgi:hypothetical protein
LRLKLLLQNLTKYKSSGSDKIPAELIKAGDETYWSEINKLVNSVWNKEELPDKWKKSIIVQIYEKDDKNEGSNY